MRLANEREIFSRTRLTFLCLVILAFSLRTIYFNQTIQFIQPGLGLDSHFYLHWAKDIVRGEFIGKDVFHALPLYPYFLSLAYIFAAGEIFDLILIQMLIGSLNCGLIYILGKNLFNNRVGITASLISSGYFMFIFYDRILLPTSLAIFFGLFLALLLLKVRNRPSKRGWLGVGLFLALSTLLSASFSLLLIFILFWIIFEYKKKSIRQLLLYCLSFVLPFFLIIGGVSLRNYLVSGDTVFITAHSGINFYIGNNSQANGLFKPLLYMRPTQSGLIEDSRIIAEKITGRRLKASEVSSFWFRRSLDFIKHQPLNYLRLLGKKFALFCSGREHIDEMEYFIYNEEAQFSKLPLFRFSFILPLALLGVFFSWPQRRKIIFLYLFLFSLTAATLFFFINSRYRLIVVPFFIIFAGEAFWQIFQKYKNKEYKSLFFSLFLFFTLYFLTNIGPSTADTYQQNYSFHYNKGIILYERRYYQKAEKELRTALRLNPHDFMSYFALGNLYYKMQDFPRAIESYEKSLQRNPYFHKPHFNLGVVYVTIGQDKDGEEEFRRVLELKPDYYAAYYNLGRIYQKEGLTELALKEYRQAIKIKPGHQAILQAMEEIGQDEEYEKLK